MNDMCSTSSFVVELLVVMAASGCGAAILFALFWYIGERIGPNERRAEMGQARARKYKAQMQSMFDTVARHLLTQNQRSVGDVDGRRNCMYRDPGGLKCAIGVLIPDNLYTVCMEGTAINGLLCKYPALQAHVPSVGLATALQQVHDLSSTSYWTAQLHAVAQHYELSAAVLPPLTGTITFEFVPPMWEASYFAESDASAAADAAISKAAEREELPA